MATRTISAAGGNSNVAATYDENLLPTASDDIVCRGDGTSGSFVVAAALACRSADFTNYPATSTVSGSSTWAIGTSSAGPGNVALKLVAGMGFTYTGTISFVSTVTGNTITTAGQTMKNFTINGALGSWTLQDTLNAPSGTLTLTAGTFNSNAQSMTWNQISITSNSTTRQFTFTNSAITLTGTNVSVMFVGATTTGLTISDTGATYNLTGGGTHTWAGNGRSFGAVTVTGGNLTVTGANTFAALIAAGLSTLRTIILPSTATTTVTTLTLTGGNAAPLLVRSSTGASAATLTVTTATVNYVAFKDITGNFTVTDSINVSGNSGITFGFDGAWSLNDAAYLSLRNHYPTLTTLSLQDLLTKFATDNSLTGTDSWRNFFGGSGAFNDRAMAYWKTHN